MVNLWVWENILVSISVTLGQGHQATEAKQILPCLHDKVRTAHLIAAKLSLYIPLVMLSTIWGMGGPIDVSQKGNGSTGCYADYGTFDLDLWPLIFHGQIVSLEWDFRVKSGICYLSKLTTTTKKTVRLPWNKIQTYRLNARPQLRSSALTLAMTLSLHFQCQIWNFVISQPKMVRLPWNKKQTYQLKFRPQMGSSELIMAMTLTLNIQG